MLRIGLPEIIVILIVVLIIFGPKNLPKLGAALGKTVKNFRSGMEGKSEHSDGSGEADEADSEDASGN